jgi:hypothetical protein
MNRSLRNAVLFAGTVCFLAMASGTVLYAHLTNVEDLAAHDTSHCTLCQQLLVSGKNCTAEIGAAEIEIDLVGHVLAVCLDDLGPQTISLRFHARAPPA